MKIEIKGIKISGVGLNWWQKIVVWVILGLVIIIYFASIMKGF